MLNIPCLQLEIALLGNNRYTVITLDKVILAKLSCYCFLLLFGNFPLMKPNLHSEQSGPETKVPSRDLIDWNTNFSQKYSWMIHLNQSHICLHHVLEAQATVLALVTLQTVHASVSVSLALKPHLPFKYIQIHSVLICTYLGWPKTFPIHTEKTIKIDRLLTWKKNYP